MNVTRLPGGFSIQAPRAISTIQPMAQRDTRDARSK